MSNKGKFAIGVALTALGLTFLLFAPAAQADILYWTTTPGSMSPGSGVWDTDAFWATDSGGNLGDSAGAWVDSSVADFSAGSTPSSTITINSAVNAAGVTFDGTGYTVTGGQLNLVGGGVITANQNATINSVIGGSVGLTLNGGGVLALTAVNTYTGTTVINAGTLKVATPNAYIPGGLPTPLVHYTMDGTGTINAGDPVYNTGSATGVNATMTHAGASYATGIINQGISFTGARILQCPYCRRCPFQPEFMDHLILGSNTKNVPVSHILWRRGTKCSVPGLLIGCSGDEENK